MPTTFATFLDDVVRTAWPHGEAEIYTAQHKADVGAALTYIQKHVPCYSTKNLNIIDYCATYYSCGLTVVAQPYKSHIQRVYTVPEEKWCCWIFYDFVSDYDQFLNLAQETRKDLVDHTAGDGSLPEGMYVASDETDKSWRARSGVYTIHNGRIYVYPHIESTERLCIEWNGVRRKWNDTDVIPISQDFTESEDEDFALGDAVVAKLLAEHAFKYEREFGEADKYEAEWLSNVAELAWECKQQNRPKEQRHRRWNQIRPGCHSIECGSSSSSSSSSSS